MSVTIERMGEHRQEDWAIQMFAVAMLDEIAPHIAKKELPYFHALMNAVQRHPDLFRRRGFTFNGMRFSQHERDRRGKLVRCVADFGNEPPTDEMIEKACKVGV